MFFWGDYKIAADTLQSPSRKPHRHSRELSPILGDALIGKLRAKATRGLSVEERTELATVAQANALDVCPEGTDRWSEPSGRSRCVAYLSAVVYAALTRNTWAMSYVPS